MNQESNGRMPLWEAVKRYMSSGSIPFHTPGHKGGKGVEPDFLGGIGEQVFQADLSEIPGLDDLHNPAGPIAEAQAKAAVCFGAGETFFLINGATAGLQAALLALTEPGQKILVPRNMHRSVWGAMVLAGCRPVYLQPEWNQKWGIFLGIEPGAVATALKEDPDLKAMVLLHPSYEGLVSDLREVVSVAKKAGLAVIADEAHGGHFRFHPSLPDSALEAGVDVAVQGTHKLLGAMTQAAMLHCRIGFSAAKIKTALSLLQSTSPSYLLLMSLDAARENWAISGSARLEKLFPMVRKIRQHISAWTGMECLGSEVIGKGGVFGIDLTRLVISARLLGLSGFELGQKLRSEFAIQPEMATLQYVLLLLTIGDDQASLDSLERALRKIIRQNPPSQDQGGTSLINQPAVWPRPVVRFPPREAFFAGKARVPLAAALGRAAGELVAPYPPGIPLLCPGELITAEVIECLTMIKREKITCQGPFDQSLETIGVIDE